MNITYIFGNGFDLQLGLNSRYSDFLKKYIRAQDSDNNNIIDFKEYLSDNTHQELWSDAEIGMGDHLKEFSNDSLHHYNERIADFETRMIEYLEEEQARCSFENSQGIKQIFQKFIMSSFQDVMCRRGSEIGAMQERDSNVFNFITFNYTNLLDKIRDCFADSNFTCPTRQVDSKRYIDQVKNIYHVHGALSSQIIMGVNDESQLNLNGGVVLSNRLKRQMIKPILNSECRYNWDVMAHNAILASDVILIYGVSYGATDNIWWDEIHKWLKDDTNHKLVAFIRDANPNFNPRIPWEEMDYEEEKRREILIKLGVEPNDNDFEKLVKQVYIIINTKRLELKEVLKTANNQSIAAFQEQTLQKIEEGLSKI